MSEKAIAVTILRYLYLDDIYPTFVECRFVDAFGQEWYFQQKHVYFTADEINIRSEYPLPGFIPCQVIETRVHPDGRPTVVVDTEFPEDLASTTDKQRFEIFADQLIDITDWRV